MGNQNHNQLHRLIFAGMGGGILAGILLWRVGSETGFYVQSLWFLDLVGKTIFVGALKMLVAPLIFASIVAGITSLPSTRELGSLGWKTLVYYFGTTAVAVLIGLLLVNVIRPGYWTTARTITAQRRANLEQIERDLKNQDAREVERLHTTLPPEKASLKAKELESSFHLRFLTEITRQEESSLLSRADVRDRYQKLQQREQTPLSFFKDILAGMIQNPFYALANNSSLGIIFFAILLGLACMAVGEAATPVVDFFRGLNAAILQLTNWVMKISPVAVFCLMASLIASHGPEVFRTLAGYVFTVIAGIAIHVCFLLLLCKVAGKQSPLVFLKGIRDAWLIAFSTRSSAATLPVTIECVEKNLGVQKKVSEFVLPVGATVNMDGTALYEGVAVIFLLQMFGALPDVGITLGFAPMILIFITAVLASVGAAAVPDAGLITMVLVANAVGLPEYYLVFIFSVDAFLDMFRTSTNVMGDAIGAAVLQRWEGNALDAGASPRGITA